MKLIPKNLFKSKKTRSISRSENTSFGSVTTTSSADSITNGISTPTSVLPEISSELTHVFAKIQKDELSDNTQTNMLPDKIRSQLIQAYDMIGVNTKPTGILPDKISSEVIHACQMIGANTKIQKEEFSGNTEISSELIQAYQMIGADTKIQKEKTSYNTPTGMLSEIPSELIHVFQMIDADTSTSVLPEIPSELELLFVNGDGCVSLQELRDTFDFFDVNHDGKITAEELFNVFTTIGEERCTLEDCRRMISGVDKNGDGFVCFEDFCLMMEQQR
ncbi:unnamed protein product [Withania somnifera]